jgi:hypothetical protein
MEKIKDKVLACFYENTYAATPCVSAATAAAATAADLTAAAAPGTTFLVLGLRRSVLILKN